jgi:hypothetical protein
VKTSVVIHLLALVRLYTSLEELDTNYSIDPYKLIKVGKDEAVHGDPLVPIQKELADIKYVKVPGLPSFTGK